MRRASSLLFVIFLFYEATARAEWLPAGGDDYSKIFLDSQSPRQNADKTVFVRALTDYDPKTPKSFKRLEGGLSEIESVIFDCARDAYRSEGGVWYVGHMATGAVSRHYGAATWAKVPSYYAGLFTKVCAAP